MLNLSRLPLERQRNVATALATVLAEKTYKPEVVAAGKAVIAAGKTLGPTVIDGPTMSDVDHATDSVTAAICHRLENTSWVFNNTVVPDSEKAIAARTAAELLLSVWFSGGLKFIQLPYGLQWDALAQIAKSFTRADVKQAVATLGLQQELDHWNAHIELYGRILGITAVQNKDSAKSEELQESFHETFVHFAAVVTAFYPKDPTTKAELLAPYQQQLDELQRERDTARRKERKKKSADEDR